MTNLGSTSAPGGLWTDVGRPSTQWIAGPYTMPSPGGTITDMYLGIGPDGNSSCDFCIWFGTTLVYNDTNHFLGVLQSQHLGGLSIWCPAGTAVYLGMWQAGSTGIEWNVGGTTGVTFQSASGPANRSGGSDEYGGAGFGCFQSYVTYTPLPAPTVTNVTPNPTPPGSLITVTGTNFLHATGVTIGGVSASFTIVSDTQITATIPAGVAGSNVTVAVTNPAGTGSNNSLDIGQIWTNPSSGVAPLKNVYCNPGSGVALIKGVFTNAGSGVKQIW